MSNAHAARDWLTTTSWAAALSPNTLPRCRRMSMQPWRSGFRPILVFPMWDWVGRRYSVLVGHWPAPIILGLQVMSASISSSAGGEAMDRHFETAALEQELAGHPGADRRLARGLPRYAGATAILPYDHRLRLFCRSISNKWIWKVTAKAPDGWRARPSMRRRDRSCSAAGGSASQLYSFSSCCTRVRASIPCDFIVAIERRRCCRPRTLAGELLLPRPKR